MEFSLVGSKVVYFPCQDDEKILMIGDTAGCHGVVSGDAGQGRFNLIVEDHFGNKHERRSVKVLPSGGKSDEPDYAVLTAGLPTLAGMSFQTSL